MGFTMCQLPVPLGNCGSSHMPYKLTTKQTTRGTSRMTNQS